MKNSMRLRIDSKGLYYRDLNMQMRSAVQDGVESLDLINVCGQRFMGASLKSKVDIQVHGTPGNDLAAFMDGPSIVVHGNAQDGCGNTMNSGEVIVHGRAGDAAGHAMRGGRLYIRDDVGYRAAIHMKEYSDVQPCIVIGGTAQHFLGEYMAGGVLVVLGLTLRPGERHTTCYIGAGMHGGVMYIRGELQDHQLGREVGRFPLTESDRVLLAGMVERFAIHFNLNADVILDSQFVKLAPLSSRPFGRLYAY
jgi:glutamate synthase domain-containing protein 3